MRVPVLGSNIRGDLYLISPLRSFPIGGKPASFGRVRMWRGGLRFSSAYLLPPLSVGGASIAGPSLRFHILLIEPDMRISRIRLSDKTSRLCTRKVIRTPLDFTTQSCVTPVYNKRVLYRQPPLPPPGWSFASQIEIRVLSSLQHLTPSAAPAPYRSCLGLPQSPVLCDFQRLP